MHSYRASPSNSISVVVLAGNKSFSLINFNCRSLLPKLDKLAALCSANNPNIVCLVETWLCDDVLNNEVCIPNYSIIGHDRSRHGGEVAI